MNATIRRIAVSGAAAVALLGGAAAAATAATEEHEATVLAVAHTDTQDPADITNGITPDGGQGAAIQNPLNQQQLPANVNPQQIQTQASGAAIGTGVVAIAILGIIVFFRVKGGHLKVGDAVVVVFLGVALSATVIGSMADQITDSGVASLGGILSGL